MRDAERAKTLLAGGATLALVRGEREIVGEERGIKQLFALCERGEERGFAAADKIVGRAAAFLYILMGVTSVYAEVMSAGAATLLTENGISAEAGTIADTIVNRAGTGLCPMEEAVLGIGDPLEAKIAVGEKLKRLGGAKPV